jgi:integrase
MEPTITEHLRYEIREALDRLPLEESTCIRIEHLEQQPHCSAHSVRKGTLTMLAMKARTMHEIAAYGGHASLKMVEVYTKAAEREALAMSAAEVFDVSTEPRGRVQKDKLA